jgi:guanine deaminase
MPTDDEFLRMAIEEAKAGIRAGDGGPFGCVITKGGEIVATGHNRVLVDGDPTSHAEIVAIRRACNVLGTIDLSGCVLYASSEPCPMCKSAIYWSNVDRIVYAASVSEADEYLGFRDLIMLQSFQKGEDMIPSERIALEGYLEPFREYKEMDGTIY